MWARGEPCPDISFDCVIMNSRTGYWQTENCLSAREHICKIALGRIPFSPAIFFIVFLGDFDYKLRQEAPPPPDNRCKKMKSPSRKPATL